MRQNVVVLGATGSIGQSTLDVMARNPQQFQLLAVSAHHNLDALVSICKRFSPRYAVCSSEQPCGELRARFREAGVSTELLLGTRALEDIAALPEADVVVAAIVGAAGLLPTLAAARSGKRILLANKEALVMSGDLFMQVVRQNGAKLLPIDSEHNAIFQCLPHSVQQASTPEVPPSAGVRRLLLTASGGPFLNLGSDQLAQVTPAQACKHPRWEMGRKISVDSASLMNKGLELIEACWLFDLPPEKVDVHIHPQAIIHSLVEYVDGSILAQLGSPDMRTPIANALAWPERVPTGVTPLDLFTMGALTFQAPDMQRFPCLRLAAEAHRSGGLAAAILNAANEEAVSAFLGEQIRFVDIPRVIEQTLERVSGGAADSLEAILAADREARVQSHQFIGALQR